MRTRFWEIKETLEGLGMTVSIKRNQNEDGTLSKEWMHATRTIEDAAIGFGLALAEDIENLVPERHSVKVERYQRGLMHVSTSYHPDREDILSDEDNRRYDFDIVRCYVACPIVSDVEEAGK